MKRQRTCDIAGGRGEADVVVAVNADVGHLEALIPLVLTLEVSQDLSRKGGDDVAVSFPLLKTQNRELNPRQHTERTPMTYFTRTLVGCGTFLNCTWKTRNEA